MNSFDSQVEQIELIRANPFGHVLHLLRSSQLSHDSWQLAHERPESKNLPILHTHVPSYWSSESSEQSLHWFGPESQSRQFVPHAEHISPSMNSLLSHFKQTVSPSSNPAGHVWHLSEFSQVEQVSPHLVHVSPSMKKPSLHWHTPFYRVELSPHRRHWSGTVSHSWQSAPQLRHSESPRPNPLGQLAHFSPLRQVAQVSPHFEQAPKSLKKPSLQKH